MCYPCAFKKLINQIYRLIQFLEKDVTSSSGGLEIASWAQWAASAISSKLYVKKEDKPKDQESNADETRENSEFTFYFKH
jgi:hypothetical protein